MKQTFGKGIAVSILVVLFFSEKSKGQSVDPLTGRAVVNLPLGGISAMDISIPVNLGHHGGAVKVDEGPGEAGVGWSVQLGGSIYREVRGLPDELNTTTQKGWLYNNNANANAIQSFNPTDDDNLADCTDESSYWTFVNSLNTVNDSESDVYYFSAPGISGKFIYGADGLPKLIPYQDLTIGGNASSFFIYTNTGMVYSFQTTETTTRQAFKGKQYNSSTVPYSKTVYNYYQNPVTYISSWQLSSIRSTSSGATANFTYANAEQALSINYLTGIAPSSTKKTDTLYYVKDVISSSILTQVSLKSYVIDLNWANNVLSQILISETETGDKNEIDFIYQSAKSTFQANGGQVKPFLREVKQAKSCLAYPPYKFSYYGINTTSYDSIMVPLPWKQGWGKDFFGYYNGGDSSTNKTIPTVYFYQSESGARRLRVSPIPGVTETKKEMGSNREVNPAFLNWGALSRIDMPSGGYTTIAYESNKYYDATTSEEKFGPGLRVASITTLGGETATNASAAHAITKSYEYTAAGSSTTSGRLVYPPVFAFIDSTNIYRSVDNMAPSQELYYGRVKEITPGLGYKVYTFDLPDMYPDVAPIVPMSKVARKSGDPCNAGLLQNGIYSFPFAPIQDLSFKRGRLRKVSEFTDGNVLTRERRLTYTTQHTAASIKALRFEAIPNANKTKTRYYYSVYQIPYGQSQLLTSEVSKTIGDESPADSIKVTTNYQYNALDQLTQTTRTNADNSVVKNFIKYTGDFNITSPVGGQARAINKLNTTNRKGLPVEAFTTFTPIGGAEIYTGASLSIYKDYGVSGVFPYQSKRFPQGLSFTPAYSTTGATQSFVYDSTKYILDNTVEYDVRKLLVNQTGVMPIPTSTHYAINSTMPLATFVNCKAEHAVYEGFEVLGSHGLTVTGTATYPAGRTGKKGLQFDSTAHIGSGSVTKNGSSYRISFWANAPQATTFTVQQKNGSTVQSFLTLSLTAVNQWTYLEGVITLAGVNNTFTWQIITNLMGANTAQIDDFVAMPKDARVSFQTAMPLTGITSKTDDRGNSATVAYDLLGRKVNTFDHQRNLVELTEYSFQQQGQITPNPQFTSNTTQYVQGWPTTFTAAPSCLSGMTYKWNFTDFRGVVTTATGSSINKIFQGFGPYNVKCTVSAPGSPSQSFTQSICVLPSFDLRIIAVYSQVPDSNPIPFTANFVKWTNTTGFELSYAWEKTDNTGAWTPISGVDGSTCNIVSPGYSFQVRCTATLLSSPLPKNADCSFTFDMTQPIAVATFSVTY